MADIATGLEALLAQVGGQPVPMALLARLLLTQGQTDRAIEIAERAVAMAPDHPEVLSLAAGVLSHGVPHWHFAIVRDLARNAAYDAALRRAVRPTSRVLEIGAGTGLLSMMAARAGAAEVVACELDRKVAAIASRIVANNGFAGRIKVVAKHSDDLRLGADLDQPADVLVSEIVSNDLLREGALAALEQARGLLRPDAQVIPARGAIRIALAEDLEADRERMDIVDGFDLSAFNALMPARYHIKVGARRLVLRSAAETLFSFDFRSARFPTGKAEVSLSASGGRVGGVAQWIRLDMDEHGWYENRPAVDTTSCWDALFYPLPKWIELHAGDKVIVRGAHDRESLRIWAQAPVGK
jgi:type II protein arginine methyltransferase